MSLIPKIDSALKSFLLKMVSAIAVWKLLYLLFLKPIRVPDAFLTNTISAGVVWLSNFIKLTTEPLTWVKYLYNKPTFCGIMQNEYCKLIIEDSCNGLELILIYIGIILLLPGRSIQRTLSFIFGGILVLIIANIIRCTALLDLIIYHPNYFEFNHHYVFTLVMYIVIFSGWMLYTKNNSSNEIK